MRGPKAPGPKTLGPTPGPDAPGPKALGPDALAPKPDGPPTDGLDTDELLVRVLLQRAVAEVQPDPAGLHRIRRAVPRRRAARRGAWTAAAALAVAVAIGLPALHDDDHLGLSGGPGTPGASGATPSATVEGTAGTDAPGPNALPHPEASGSPGAGSPSGSASTPPRPGASSADAGAGASARPSASSTGGGDDAPVPLCLRGDLGQGTARVGAADGDGRIYGYFTVVNTSAHTCRLGGPGSVAVTGATGTDQSRIRVTDHTADDPATDLAAPRPGGGDGPGLLLAPQAAYRVDFGWVPDGGGCRTAGGVSPSATAGQSGPGSSGSGGAQALRSGGPGGSAAGSGTGAVAPAIGASAAPTGAPPASATPTAGPTTAPSPSATPTSGPTAPPAGVTLAHTPAPGSPSAASVVLPGACSGTVYRTVPQAVVAPTPTGTSAPSTSPSSD